MDFDTIRKLLKVMTETTGGMVTVSDYFLRFLHRLPVECHGHNNPFCAHVKGMGGNPGTCNHFENRLIAGVVQSRVEAREAGSTTTPFCKRCYAGATEICAPLLVQGELVGRVALGPYRWSEEMPPEDLVQDHMRSPLGRSHRATIGATDRCGSSGDSAKRAVEKHTIRGNKSDSHPTFVRNATIGATDRGGSSGDSVNSAVEKHIIRGNNSEARPDFVRNAMLESLPCLTTENLQRFRLLLTAFACSLETAISAFPLAKPVGLTRRDLILDLLQKSYFRPLQLTDAAARLHLSPSRASAVIQEEFGESFIPLLQRVRLEKSRELLRNTGLSVAEIARICGFPNPNYLFRLFKREVGITPHAWRRHEGEPPTS